MALARACLLFCALVLPPTLMAQDTDINVVALFKGSAMLEINGVRKLLRAGQTSDEGVHLVSADSTEARVRFQDEEVVLNLSSHIGTRFRPRTNASVSINRNDNGQYRTTGSINGRPVSFLVDTGANIVAINTFQANDLGINYQALGRASRATTAGGVVRTWEVTLDAVTVGEITVPNVRAAILEGGHPREILLGMTFLQNVEMSESSGVMVLKSNL